MAFPCPSRGQRINAQGVCKKSASWERFFEHLIMWAASRITFLIFWDFVDVCRAKNHWSLSRKMFCTVALIGKYSRNERITLA